VNTSATTHNSQHSHTIPPGKCYACGRSFGKLVQQSAQIAKLFHELGDEATDAELIAGAIVQLTYAVNVLSRQLEGGAR